MKKKILFTSLALALLLSACGSGEISADTSPDGDTRQAVFADGSEETEEGNDSLDDISGQSAVTPTDIANRLQEYQRFAVSGPSTVYIQDDGSITYSAAAFWAGRMAETFAEKGLTPIMVTSADETFEKVVFLCDDGQVYYSHKDGSCFPGEKITYIDADFYSRRTNDILHIYGVTDEGRVLYSNGSETVYTLEGVSGVKYVKSLANNVILLVYQNGTAGFATIEADSTPYSLFSDVLSTCDISGWTDIVWADIGYYTADDTDHLYAIGLQSDGSVVTAGDCPSEISEWENMVFAEAGRGFVYGLRADGTPAMLTVDPESSSDFSMYDGWQDLHLFRFGDGDATMGSAIGNGGTYYGKACWITDGVTKDGEHFEPEFSSWKE